MTITEKIDAITGIKDEQKCIDPPCPKSVKIELTARCNLRCSFCASSHDLREKGEMDFDFYSERLLPMLKEAGVEELGMFFLGESTIRQDLPRFIAEARYQGFPYIFLTTNGTALTAQKIESYMQSGLHSLKFSMNYSDAEQFSEVTRTKPALFKKMLTAIKEARRIRDRGGYHCGLYASYIEYDGDQKARMDTLVADVRPFLDEIYALPLYSQADLTGESSEDEGWEVRAGNPGRAGAMRDPIPCWSLFTEGRVTYDGHLAACCFDHDSRFDMGDLNDLPFMEAWHSHKFRELRAAHLTGVVTGTSCEGCVAYS